MDVIEIRRMFHRRPEIGGEERWTSAQIARMLGEMGYEVHTGVAETGVVGILRAPCGDVPTVAYRADMDALPVSEETGLPFASDNGLMHACGHDAHMAIALVTAHALLHARPDKCNLAFVFQPNEEGAPGGRPSGAYAMCCEHLLERFNIRQMVALHCAPELDAGQFGIASGAAWAASSRFVAHVDGASAHAAYPCRGRDALFAASQMVNALYASLARMAPLDHAVLSVCRLTAGNAFNVIAPDADFEGIIRADSKRKIGAIFEAIQKVCHGVADAFGVSVTLSLFYGADAVVNDPRLSKFAWNVLSPKFMLCEVPMNMASEDFSYFSEKIPALYLMMGVRPPGGVCLPLHSSRFCPDESAFANAVDLMRTLMLRLAGLHDEAQENNVRNHDHGDEDEQPGSP